jgi:hypothetical protein
LLTGDQVDVAIVAEAAGTYAVTSNGAADVADGAGAEVCDAIACGRVHDVAFTSIARAAAVGAAKLLAGGLTVVAGLARAVVDGTEGMASLVAASSDC